MKQAKWKKYCSVFMIAALVCGMLTGCGGSNNKEIPKIGIVQLVSHGAGEDAAAGFKQALADNGFVDGETVTLIEQNGQNEQSNLESIAQSFLSEEVDLICAVSTSTAQVMAAATGEIPIVGTAITNYIVVPNVVWDYSSGKFVPAHRANVTFGGLGFIPRPRSINIDETILEAVARAMESDENECHIHIGPMACGTTVVANSEVVEKQVHSQYSNTAALDMESYAVMYATKAAPAPKPMGIVIKSVCDYANEEKSDQYQKFAAFTSAQFSKLLYEKFLT